MEWAIVGGLMLSLMLGALDLGRYFFILQSLRHVVGEAARAAFVSQVPGCTSPVAAHVGGAPGILAAPALQAANLTLEVCVSPPNTSPHNGEDSPTRELTRVDVTASYRFDFAFLPLGAAFGLIRERASFAF